MKTKIYFWLPLVAIACCLLVALYRQRTTAPDGLGSIGSPGPSATAFVDERACVECHSEEAGKHARNGHADTFRSTRESAAAQQLAGRTFFDAERRLTYAYQVDAEGRLAVSLPDQLGGDLFPLDYALGSGHNALTFLSLIPDGLGDTVGVEHRLTLYRSGDEWELDLTPGHRGAVADQEVELFGKLMRGDTLTGCIGCHTVTAEIRGHQLADVRPHVGCQSCHGAGAEHVAAMRGDDLVEDGGDYGALPRQTAAEQVALCGKCHRLPADQPPADLSPNIIQNVRFQPAGLIQSECYTASQSLRCSSCHDPHDTVSRDQRHYEQRCLNCHEGTGQTACPVSPQDRCIDCHMPAVDVHRGIEFHDHWIRVRRDAE